MLRLLCSSHGANYCAKLGALHNFCSSQYIYYLLCALIPVCHLFHPIKINSLIVLELPVDESWGADEEKSLTSNANKATTSWCS